MKITKKQKRWLEIYNALSRGEMSESEARTELQKIESSAAMIYQTIHIALGGSDVQVMYGDK